MPIAGSAQIQLMDNHNTPIVPEQFEDIVRHFCTNGTLTLKLNVKIGNKVPLVSSQVT